MYSYGVRIEKQYLLIIYIGFLSCFGVLHSSGALQLHLTMQVYGPAVPMKTGKSLMFSTDL